MRDRKMYAGKKVDPFYLGKPWRLVRMAVLRRDCNVCQVCKKRFGNTVHHIIPRKERPDLELCMENLETVCDICHNQEHPEKGRPKNREHAYAGGVRIVKL